MVSSSSQAVLIRRGTPVSDSSQATPRASGVDGGGGVVLGGPALAKHHIGGGVGGAAEREPVGEQVPHGRVDDLVRGPLGGQDEDHPGSPAAGDQVAGQGGELFAFGFLADGGGVVGVLVDDHQVDVLAVVAGDLAPAGGQQPCVAAVHDLLEFGERLDGVLERGADEGVGAVAPGAELDLVAVDQDQAAVPRQGAVRDDQVLRGGLAAAGLTAQQHVALGQVDVDGFAVLVHAQVDRVEHGQREHRHGLEVGRGDGGHGGCLLSG